MCKICANYLRIDKKEDHLNDRQETMPYHTANELNKKRGEPNERKGDYRYKIDEGNVTLIQEIEDDYRRRQGNIVLKLCKGYIAANEKNTRRSGKNPLKRGEK